MYILHLALKTKRGWYFTHTPRPPPHNGAIVSNFGMLGVIADVINHPRQIFCQSVQGFGSSDLPKFCYLHIGLASRPYNSVSTAVLHCDGSFDHNHMRSFCGWFEIAYLYTKFDSSNRAVKDSLSHSLDSLWIGGLKFKMGHVTCPFQGRFVLGGLGLATINLCTKFEISRFTHYKDMKGDDQCKKLGGLGG